MRQLGRILLAATLAWGMGMPAAQAAASLDELLKQTRDLRAADSELAAKRQAEFNSNPGRQEQMLQQALAERAAAATASEALSDTYDNNELKINEMNGKLRQREAELGVGELFGLARQVAGDTAAVLHQSMISAQFPAASGQQDREEFLRTFASGKILPSAAQLERLWFEMQRETTESGKVVRFNAAVVQPNGTRVEKQVVRIGPFTAVTDDGFVNYLPSLGAFTMLPRQPPEEFLDVAAKMTKATGGYTQAIVDPGRGVMLLLYSERPNTMERVEKGELIGYITIAVGLLGALLWAYQFIYLVLMRVAMARQLDNLDRPSSNNPLGRVLLAFKGDTKRIEEDAEVAELRITEAVLREVPRLERFQAFLRLAVAAGPLLGLIGTVVGMIITFQSITESGSSDPRLMANGISQAMIATVLGLGIAIPLLFANAVLASLSRSMVQILDQQSAGLLAESIEKRRRA